jgi:hypothetical protein
MSKPKVSKPKAGKKKVVKQGVVKQGVVKKKVDVEGILNTLATLREAARQQLPKGITLPTSTVSEDTAFLPSFVPGDEESMEAFEMETLAVALESFANELTASIQAAREKALAQALEVYYTAEKLAREPEHANLIPVVEEMREAYRRDFGKDIPPKKE